jgi:hypothetical protein
MNLINAILSMTSDFHTFLVDMPAVLGAAARAANGAITDAAFAGRSRQELANLYRVIKHHFEEFYRSL